MPIPTNVSLSRWQRLRLESGRWWFHRVHRILRRKVTPGGTFRQVVLAFIYICPFLFTQALTWGEKKGFIIWLGVLYVLVQVWRAYGEMEPRGWDDAREHYIDRKHEFGSVLTRLGSRDVSQLDHSFQRDCLWLVANYVRAWRWDLAAKNIFANLLIEDPEDSDYLIVIARDREQRVDARPVPKRYLRSERLISECFNTGKYCEVGNLSLQSGNRDPDCPYKSILGLPLKDDSGKVIAVVSIDSSLRHHFAMEGDLLEVYLQPYLVTLRPSVELEIGRRTA